MGIFAQRELTASQLDHCGSPIPITCDAAIPHPLFILDEVLGYFHCGLFPKGSLLVACLFTCLSLCDSMLFSTPGWRQQTCLYRLHRIAYALYDRIGPFPIYTLLGATCQIQGYTLHLVSLVTLSFLNLVVNLVIFTTERLTTPYSGRLTHLRRVPPHQATIARSPIHGASFLCEERTGKCNTIRRSAFARRDMATFTTIRAFVANIFKAVFFRISVSSVVKNLFRLSVEQKRSNVFNLR